MHLCWLYSEEGKSLCPKLTSIGLCVEWRCPLTLASLLLYPKTLSNGAVFSGAQSQYVRKLKFIGWCKIER